MTARKRHAAFAAFSAAALASSAAMAESQDAKFKGPYIGAEASLQQIIAGAEVAGVDVLAEDRRFVAELFGGYRYQFPIGLIIGAEAAYGLFDGDLAQNFPVGPTMLSYDGGDQFSYGGTVGWAVGRQKALMIFGYIKETKRSFDVAGASGGTTFFQQDKQGMLRYGGGAEVQVARRLHLRASIGTGRADFGDQVTNIDPGSKIEASLGLLAQF